MNELFVAPDSYTHRLKTVLNSPGRTLVLVNLVVFAVMVLSGVSVTSPLSGDLLDWGANFAPLTNCGEPWRLVTSMFVHIGLMHLAFNMWVLWSYSPIAEALFGKLGFLVLYFGSGIVASATSAYWHPEIMSAGASGAIFGMVGAMIAALGLSTRRGSPAGPLVAFVVYNVIFGFTVPAIDNAAHLGGLVGGWVCGKLLGPPRRGYGGRKLVRYLLAPAFAVALAVTLGSFADEQRCIEGKLHMAMRAVDKDDRGKALSKVRALSREYPQNALVRKELGRLLAVAGDYEQALLELDLALALNPESVDAEGLRAFCLANLGRVDEAVSTLERAIERNPKDSWLKNLLKEIRAIQEELR